MSGNPWSAITSGVSSGLTFLIKICEYTYALRAVDQQTKEYLITAQHASDNIKICRDLLVNMKDNFSISEIKQYERVIEDVKKAAQEVALLLEPARVDVEADCKIQLSTRVKWVLSDNANTAAALRRSDIVHTTLAQNISTLRLMSELARSKETLPTYESSQVLQWKRQIRLTPRQSVQTLSINRSVSSRSIPSVIVGVDEHTEEIWYPTLARQEGHPLGTGILALGVQVNNTDCETHSDDMNVEVPSTTGRRPRSWLEYQAMKGSRKRETGSNGSTVRSGRIM